MIPSIDNPRLSLNEIQFYIAIGVKHFRLLVLLMSLALATGLAYFVYRRPVYYAKALIEVKTAPPKPIDAETVFRDSRVDFIRQQLVAPHIIERTARRLGIRGSLETIQRRHVRKLRVYVNSESNIEIQVYATSPKAAQEWAKTALEAFLEYRDEERMAHRTELLAAYTKELARIREKIDEFARQEEAFRDRRQWLESEIALKAQRALPRELMQVRNRFGKIADVLRVVKNGKLSVLERLAVISAVQTTVGINLGRLPAAGLDDTTRRRASQEAGTEQGDTKVVVVPALVEPEATWQKLERTRLELLADQRELAETYLPGHPRLMAVANELKQIDSDLAIELENYLNRLTIEHDRLKDRRAELEAQLPAYKAVQRRHEALQREHAQLEAGRLGWEKMYKKLAAAVEEMDFSADSERTCVTYAGLLQANEYPVSPNRFKLVILSLLLGLGLCVAVPFSVEYLDNTFTLMDRTEQKLGLRGLGVVPLAGLSRDQAEGRRHVLLADSLSSTSLDRPITETFRMIRTNLQADQTLPEARQVIMVSSSIPREGKSLISTNLALSFARLGEQTLLIDGDLRRGRLHETFGLPRSPGLSTLLKKRASEEECIVRTPHDSLDLLPVGTNGTSAVEHIAGGRFGTLMEGFRARYRHIIVDTAPVLGISETCDMLRYVDGVLLVIWSAYTPMHQVRASTELLAANGGKLFGFVLNRLDLGSATNYYYYFYHSDYYYSSYGVDPRRLPPASGKPEADRESIG